MVEAASEIKAPAVGIPPGLAPKRDVKENADLEDARAALARLRQEIQSNPTLSEDVKRELIQSLDGLLHNNQISAAALNAARQQIERQYTTLKTEEEAEKLVASAIQITKDDKVDQAEVSASLFNYYFDDGFGCEAPPEVRKDIERMVNAALDLRPAGGGPSLAEAIAKIPKPVRDAAQKVEEVEKIKIDRMLANPNYDPSYRAMLRMIQQERLYGNAEIQHLIAQMQPGQLSEEQKRDAWNEFNRLRAEIKASTQAFRNAMLENLDEKFKAPLATIGDPRTAAGNDAVEKRFYELTGTPEGKKRMEGLLRKDYSKLSEAEKTDVAVYHYQAGELTVRGIVQLKDTSQRYLLALDKQKEGKPLQAWEKDLVQRMEPLTSADPALRQQGVAALLKNTDLKDLPPERLNALAGEFSKKPLTNERLEEFIKMNDKQLVAVADKAADSVFDSLFASASTAAAGAAGAVAGAGGGVAAEAGKLLDDVGRRAGTGTELLKKGVGQISAGDLDGAKKTANIVGAAVMRNIEEAAGRGAISLGNVAYRVRDGAAGRDALGKG
ncbi:MAG: hypothetical protein ACK5R4_03795, partial [Alphaproteobacteria bacterium]